MKLTKQELQERYEFLIEQAKIYAGTPMHSAFTLDAEAIRFELDVINSAEQASIKFVQGNNNE